LSFTADASKGLGGPGWLARRRSEAWDRYSTSEVPSGADDLWKYSDVDRFDPDAFEPAPSVEGSGDGSVVELARSRAAQLGDRAGLVVTLNGGLLHVEGPGGESLEPSADSDFAVRRSEPDRELDRIHVARDAFDDLHWAFVHDLIEIDMRAKSAIARPVVVVHVVNEARRSESKRGTAVFPHLYVRVGASAEAKVVEIFTGVSSEAVLVMPVTELDVSENSRLSYSTLQHLPRGHRQLGVQSARVARDGSLHSFCASLGGSVGRLRADAELIGQAAEAVLVAGYLGTGSQLHDLRTIQDHVAPKTRSQLLCMGAVGDTARSAYVGLTRVRNGAHGADAFQTNHNLVLSEGAHADSVPNLDIQENDVRCSHASTVGPIDEDQLYYLESRGVSPGDAEQLIVLGFFRDLASRAVVRSVGTYFVDTVKRVLEEELTPETTENPDA
jgi:Fe-S cluster assembly protein SufD